MKLNKTCKALMIVIQMDWVKDWEFLRFAEYMWMEEYSHLFTRSYGTNTWSCKWKWPRFMAWSFLGKLRKKWLVSWYGSSYWWISVSNDWYNYLKSCLLNINFLPKEYQNLLIEIKTSHKFDTKHLNVNFKRKINFFKNLKLVSNVINVNDIVHLTQEWFDFCQLFQS